MPACLHALRITAPHQIRGVYYCLEKLGPWCAAAAAYLDLLAPPAEAEESDDEQHESEGGDELDRERSAARLPVMLPAHQCTHSLLDCVCGVPVLAATLGGSRVW